MTSTPFLSVRSVLSALAVVATTLAAASMTRAAPEPNPVPQRWELNVEFGPLRVTSVETGTGPRAFYYMTYLVTNRSGQDLLFAPSFDLVGDDGVIYRSGRDVPVEVTDHILGMLENPLLESEIDMIGNLLQGPAYAREGLAVWPAEQLRNSEIRVFAAGFSGETATVTMRDPDQASQTRTVVLRKTRMLRFDSPGELDPTSSDPVPLLENRWIMR